MSLQDYNRIIHTDRQERYVKKKKIQVNSIVYTRALIVAYYVIILIRRLHVFPSVVTRKCLNCEVTNFVFDHNYVGSKSFLKVSQTS